MTDPPLIRVRKLLALAAGSPHEEEARTAAVQAARLIAKEGFDVVRTDGRAPPREPPRTRPRPRKPGARRPKSPCPICGNPVAPGAGVQHVLDPRQYVHLGCVLGAALSGRG